MAALHVAVGVLTAADGRVLISRRADAVHQGGLWEFPGGKVETGESVEQALVREFAEELGVRVKATRPLLLQPFDYGDKAVLLDVHRISEWSGEPRGLEGQPLAWVAPEALANYAFPAANRPILQRLLAS
ncbi:MAG: 8-oxo-dGTP diphosphatase MutT [Haliea sp.]|nr:8-oxo-dGTP diphosphatase MutT [Haliea sp.]|tara:strand:+ start:79159 stop:79548 length:390 start_codon:yes stop_codon:yes gene_type:complete